METKFYYRKVLPEQVAPEKVRLAGRALALAEKRLGLPKIEIQWVKEITEVEYRVADDLAAINKAWQALRMIAGGRPDCSFKGCDCFVDGGGFWGKAHPVGSGAARIYINAGVPEGEIAFVTAHEAKHLSDWKAGLQTGLYADPKVRKRLEDRADEFGRAIEKELACQR